MGLLGDAWDFYRANRDLVDPAFWGHVRLSVTALALAAVTGVTLGIACAKIGRVAAFLVTSIGNLGRTVPTFAVMGIVLTLSTVGFWPAVIGLYLLAVPPILLNTFTGIHEVDAGVVEASRGMGFRPLQILGRVELPSPSRSSPPASARRRSRWSPPPPSRAWWAGAGSARSSSPGSTRARTTCSSQGRSPSRCWHSPRS